MFAIMELQGGGTVLKTVENLHTSGKVFSYGMTQSVKGFTVYKPGQPGVLVPFAALIKNVPPPFNQEFTGGPGQVIHEVHCDRFQRQESDSFHWFFELGGGRRAKQWRQSACHS
jgi:hypothetical protein